MQKPGNRNRYHYCTHESDLTDREENFDQPWAKLARRLEQLRLRIYWPGWSYLATGRLSESGQARVS